MVKLELYIREITRFLRTVTLKNVYFADQMLETWVKASYRDNLSLEDHPYYRHLLGKYILSNATFEAAREALGFPTEIRCREIVNILNNPLSYTAVNVRQASTDLDNCKQIFNLPELDASSLNTRIINYLKNNYGISKTVVVNGILYNTDDVYTKFDKLPIVHSFDTGKEIPFVFQQINSKAHRKTRATYKIPSAYYDKLIKDYPDEKDIIKCILYPANKSLNELYSAKNYSILGCDLTLLEEGERQSLYNAMEEKLNVIRWRWDVRAFTYENLYALSMQAKIWSILLIELFKQRVLNIRTSEVHSYHLWNYLKSKGVGEYSDALSRKQALFLYINFPWIDRHKGSDHNLLLLTHKLLHENGMTVYHKSIVNDNKSLSV